MAIFPGSDVLIFMNENSCLSFPRSNQNWLRLDRRVLDHDLPRFQEPVLLTFCVRYEN